MERQREHLVESIFNRLRPRDGKPRKSPSLFQPVAATPSETTTPPLPSSAVVGRRFPLGLDFGTASLKWAQVGLVEGRPHVVQVGSQPMKSFSNVSESERQAEVSGSLRRLITQHQLAGPVVLSLPLEDVSLRLLKLTAVPEAEMGPAIRWQVEQTLPPGVSYDEFTVDHVVLQEMAGQGESRVLVAMVPRQRVMAMVERVIQAGLQPVAVEIDPFAMATCVTAQRTPTVEGTLLMLHLGASSASLSVVTRGQLVFARSILTTGYSLTQAIADYLRVSKDDAETLKRTYGVLPPSAQAEEPAARVARALASPLENLIVDMLHTFKGFSRQMAQLRMQNFQRVILGGGGAQLPGLAPWLEARAGVPVELLDPFAPFPVLPSATAVPLDQLAAQCVVAMGLALRELSEP